jgi:hypothetical protein
LEKPAWRHGKKYSIKAEIYGRLKYDILVSQPESQPRRTTVTITNEDTGIPCRNHGCLGHIIKKSDTRYRRDIGRMMFGPAGANQMSTVTTLYCEKCGVMYHHLPNTPEG